MKPYYATKGATLWQGDSLAVLKTFPDASVNCCVTSPPYWGLRDYGVDGQLGLEKTPQEYVEKMVAMFAEVRRVLTKDGTLWLNLGDSYARMQEGNVPQSKNKECQPPTMRGRVKNAGMKAKDLVGIPWMVAFALRTDGWYLRCDIIWAKPNPMPESVTDRPTKAHEYVFLLSRSPRYHYDAEAIKEKAIYGDPRKPYAPGQVDERGNGHDRNGGKVRQSVKRGGFNGKTNEMPGREAFRAIEDWRNKRSVWNIATCPFPEAHFATFPPKLVEPCILAGCPEGGTVLDPFAGSGTTLAVAVDLGRKGVGVELNADYCAIAKRRIEAAVNEERSRLPFADVV